MCDWTVNGNGYGTIGVTRVINNYAEFWASQTIVGGITQLTQSSTEVIYLRGGGKYFFESDGSASTIATVQTGTYTTTGQTVTNTTTVVNSVWQAGAGGVGLNTLYLTGPLAVGTGLSTGSAGQLLQSNGSAATSWVSASGLTAGAASQVQTVLRTTNASHFLTFVDSNNASAAAETVYTTSTFVINPQRGFVGIGTTSPSHRLTVTESANSATTTASSIALHLYNSASDGTGGRANQTGIGFGGSTTRSAIVAGTFGNDYLDFYTNGDITTPRIRIRSTGAIAFSGTNTHGSSGSVLQSNGDAAPTWVTTVSGLSAGSATTATQVNTVRQTANANYFLTFVDSNNATATGELVYTTSSFTINPLIGVSIAPIAGNGQLSIDPTAGNGQLNLNSSAGNQSQFLNRIGGTLRYWHVAYVNNNTVSTYGTDAGFPYRVAPNGIVTLTVTTSGSQITSLGVGTAPSGITGEIRATNEITAYYSSDIRLKENIRLIADPITIVNQIRGVYYDWTDEHIKARGGEDGYFVRKHDIGVIAQEVEAVLPEIVAERDDGTKVVKYEKLVALLIEAVKDQQRQINQISQALQNLAIK
jgi:hypothetical protein